MAEETDEPVWLVAEVLWLPGDEVPVTLELMLEDVGEPLVCDDWLAGVDALNEEEDPDTVELALELI